MRTIKTFRANDDWTLDISFNDGVEKRFDVKPLLSFEAFKSLQNIKAFKAIRNGGYFLEWETEADLSADTLYMDGDFIKQ